MDAVVQQFYYGELGGLAIAEIIFGDANPSGKLFSTYPLIRVLRPNDNPSFGGKLPVSFPQNVGTSPAFYNYLKGGRPVDPGYIAPNGTLVFGHQVWCDKL